jgi:hypothetical protein
LMLFKSYVNQIRHVRDIISRIFTHFYVPKQFKNGSGKNDRMWLYIRSESI